MLFLFQAEDGKRDYKVTGVQTCALPIWTFTLHPSGLPHGPQPGAVEKALGTRETNELAVMCDTFRPLRLTTLAREDRKSVVSGMGGVDGIRSPRTHTRKSTPTILRTQST